MRKLKPGDFVEPAPRSGLRPGYGKVLEVLKNTLPENGGRQVFNAPRRTSFKADMYFEDQRYAYYGQPLYYEEAELVRIGGYQLII